MRGNKGFTLIELIIVVAIILIIAAIAYPNMVQSYLTVNEAEAVSMLRRYAEAQKEFKKNGYGAQRGNTLAGDDAYADNARNLYYGVRPGDGEALGLMPRNFADAVAPENPDGAPTVPDAVAPGPVEARQGYYFREPAAYSGEANRGKFREGYALLALPAEVGRSGKHAFWIDHEEKIWAYRLPDGVAYVPGADNPGLGDLETPDAGAAAQAKWEVR